MTEILDRGTILREAHDFSNRSHIILQFGKMIGLSNDDMSLLVFAAMGNPEEQARLPDVLKKISLPKPEVTYDREKMLRFFEYIARALEFWRKSTVVDASTGRVVKNGISFLTTPYGFSVAEIVYNSLINQLRNSPDYVISVLTGVYKALETILEFLEVEVK